MKKKESLGANLEESVYALGYELIKKEQMGRKLTETENSFLNCLYETIDEQIKRLLKNIVI